MNSINKEGHIFKYIFIGFFSATLDLISFFFLNKFGPLDFKVNNFISSHLGIFISFYLNSTFNFKKGDKKLFRFISFYIVAFVGFLAAHFYIISIFYLFSININFIKTSSFLIIFIVQFSLNKYITFSDDSFIFHLIKLLFKFNLFQVKYGNDLDIQSTVLSIKNNEFIYKFALVFSIILYIFIFFFLKIISINFLSKNIIYKILKKFFLFKLTIKYIKTHYYLK